jgi:hypothetical protein
MLGPLSFVLLINNINKVVKKVGIFKKFADNMKMRQKMTRKIRTASNCRRSCTP